MDRLAMLYVPTEVTRSVRGTRQGRDARAAHPRRRSGLVSSASDYQRFMTMLLRGGSWTVCAWYRSHAGVDDRNHLPNDVDLEEFATDSFSETSNAGVGFGLGFSVVIDSVKNKSLASEEPSPGVAPRRRPFGSIPPRT